MTTLQFNSGDLLATQSIRQKNGISTSVWSKGINADDGSQKLVLPLSLISDNAIRIWRINGYYHSIATIATDLWSDAGSEESFDAHITTYSEWMSPKAFGKLSHLRNLAGIAFEMENPWMGLKFNTDLSNLEIDFPELDIDATPTLDIHLAVMYSE